MLDAQTRGRDAAFRLRAIHGRPPAVNEEGARMDERVASAVAHWGPRFTTNGVTVSDFARVTGQVDRWDDWCAAWSDLADANRTPAASSSSQ
jgi:hypothetical protein